MRIFLVPRDVRRSVSVLVTVLMAGLAVSMGPAASPAPARQPLSITKFSMEMTEATILNPSALFAQDKVVDVPYKHPFTQAGGHPWALTTSLAVSTEEIHDRPNGGPGSYGFVPTGDPKDLVVSLPPGLLGDPLATPQCSLETVTTGKSNGEHCPADAQIGFYALEYEANTPQAGLAEGLLAGPIVNVTPEKGQSAEFALENEVEAIVTPILTAHLVHTPGGYSFTVASNDIPEIGLKAAKLTFWGVPADPSHDPLRGLFCSGSVCSGGGEVAGVARVPFLTLPSDCAAGPETASLRADSWEEPGSVGVGGQYSSQWKEQSFTFPAVTGCNLLGFAPGTGVMVQPDTRLADEPVGLGVGLQVPLNEKPESLAAPLLRDTVVTLPEGMSVSPGVVDGIQACNETGPEGINITGSESEEVGPNGELQLAPGHCPDALILGTAEAVTPFLPEPVKGHVYLARPGCGGQGQSACTNQDALDGNLYKLYLEIGGAGVQSGEGIVFKVPIETEANPATGQLTALTSELVQAPYSEVKIHLNGGPRAPLDNPATCGPALTSADFTPWSSPGTTPEGLSTAGTADVTSSSFYDVEGCAGGLAPFAPGFVAGTVSPQAGAFSAFTLNLSRQDREQYVKGIQVHTPPGLLGMLSSVTLCEEPLADEGLCPEASKIGTTRVASGAGSHPFEISGNVYLTKSYEGAPFGLSIVTDAVAGPFNLGLVVVRARIAVDPTDSTLTITTDETGPYAIPQILDGVPLRLQRVTVNIDRPGFMFNPTNCSQQKVTALVAGAQNTTASVATGFAASACQSLAFKPKFAVSTTAHTSRLNGASLDVKLSYPASAPGSEANIKSVKVELPKQLPSRLTTLQKACSAEQFNTNPAGCPAASVVGVVRASTPVLPLELTGPVYFVSHGGEAFPSLVVVLQGDGVRVDLTGSTFISKQGITSSTFKSVPDVPVGSFELYLPKGPYSALTANANLCSKTLAMPTEFIAQNGARIHQNTRITVTNCPKKKTKPRKAKTRKAGLKTANRTGHGRTR